jgi:hypothetical protein
MQHKHKFRGEIRPFGSMVCSCGHVAQIKNVSPAWPFTATLDNPITFTIEWTDDGWPFRGEHP